MKPRKVDGKFKFIYTRKSGKEAPVPGKLSEIKSGDSLHFQLPDGSVAKIRVATRYSNSEEARHKRRTDRRTARKAGLIKPVAEKKAERRMGRVAKVAEHVATIAMAKVHAASKVKRAHKSRAEKE